MTLNEAVAKLVGTSEGCSDLAEELGIETDELETVMVDAGYERCQFCDLWHEQGELILDETGGIYLCEDCHSDCP